MARIEGYSPAPGPQNPSRYPFTGAAYQQYGEQKGFIYNPYTDQYYRDPKEYQAYQEEVGLAEKPKKQPGLGEALIPVAGSALAYEGGKQLGAWGAEKGGAYLASLGSETAAQGATQAGSQGLMGLGSSGAQTGSTIGAELAATQAAAPTAQVATQSAGQGLMGLGQSGTTGAATMTSTATPVMTDATGQAIGSAMPQSAQAAQGGTAWVDVGAPSYAGYVGAALEGYNTYKTLTDDNKTDQQKAQRAQQQAALAVANVYTAGLASVAEGAMRKYAPHFMAEIDKLDAKTNPLTLAFQDSNKWKTEKRRINRLADRGKTYIPEEIIQSYENLKPMPREQQIDKSLPEDFVGFNNGQWKNNKWLKSGNEKDLRPEDIVNYAAFAENDPEWFKRPLLERLNVANTALAADAVTEEYGSITIKGKKLNDFIEKNPQGIAYTPIQNNPALGPSSPAQPTKTAATAKKGERLSPGIYADGKGGWYRK